MAMNKLGHDIQLHIIICEFLKTIVSFPPKQTNKTHVKFRLTYHMVH